MHFVQHGLREFLTRPRDYSPVVARHLLFDPDGLLATAALLASYRPKTLLIRPTTGTATVYRLFSAWIQPVFENLLSRRQI